MSHKLRRLTTVAYAVNGSGLGHLTRVLAILRWMKRLALLSGVSLEAYVLTSSEAPGLAHEEGFAAFKIPSKTAIRKAGLPKDDYLRLARQWVWHSLGLIKPDLLLVDTFPGGSFGELINALDIPGARVFINRAVKEEFARAAGVEKLLSLYDRILIPVEPAAPQRAFDTAIAAKTRRVGPIMLRSCEELRPRAEARRRLGIPEDKLGVATHRGRLQHMKFRTFRNLLLIGGATVFSGLCGTCFYFAGSNQAGSNPVAKTAPTPYVTTGTGSGGGVTELQTPYRNSGAPSAGVTTGPSSQTRSGQRREEQLILNFLASQPATTDKVKDAFPGESFKVNVYCDDHNPNWTRLKIDLDRDGKDDEKWELKDGQPAKRRVARRRAV